MENKRRYSKETIKDRMFRNAVNYWGVRNMENLDPLVKLMIEALASEIYKLSNEINNIETRIIERIAHLLTPDILMLARPAHMLLYTQPIESESIVNRRTGFYYDDPVFKQKKKVTDISFYPVDIFPLVKGRVKTMVCGRNIYMLDKTLSKEILTRSIVRSENLSHRVWFGMELDNAIEFIENLSFYIDFINVENKNDYYHLLPYTQWQHNSVPLKITSGLYSPEDMDVNTGNMSLFVNYDLAKVSDHSIRNFYNPRFITIEDKLKVSEMKKEIFPTELKSYFQEEDIDQLTQPLYWFYVNFPPSFDEDIIDRTLISANVFPVANKRHKTQSSGNQKLSNILPLETSEKEHFLSVLSVVDSHNRQYKQLPFRDTEVQQYGTFSVKKGGTERFDSRNAKEYILQLLDLLREEGAAFSLVGKGFLEDLIADVGNVIMTLEQKLSDVTQDMEIPSYLIVDSENKSEILFVDYWVTNCEIANGIKAGTYFSPHNETFVESGLIFSLTPSTGGKGRPQTSNVLDIYKYVLTSRDRIYTIEDIVNFCYSEFGDIITSVKVKKGVQVSSKPKEGLIRTIDVFVDVKKHFEPKLFDDFRSNLHNLLIDKSPDTFNYRIFVN